MTATKTGSSIYAAILNGELDGELDELANAIRMRRRSLQDLKAAQNRISLQPGDRVRLVNIKPKYMIGMTGTVADRPQRRRGDIAVDMDHAAGRYSKELSVPASCLERI